MSNQTKAEPTDMEKTARYILFKNHCHPEDGERFYNAMVNSICAAIAEERRKAWNEGVEWQKKMSNDQSKCPKS